MIYDILQNLWIDPELTHEIPKWNHCGAMIPAIPNWKYFIFGGSIGSFEDGGNRTGAKIVNDVFFLDLNGDEMAWRGFDLEPEEGDKKVLKPKERE